MKERRTLEWQEKTRVEKVKIRRKEEPHYENTQVTKETFTNFSGEFEVEIDTEAIARMLVGRAAHSKSGRSAYLAGMCKARRIKREARGVARVKEYPVNAEHWEVIP